MSIALTTVFGDQIRAFRSPRDIERQYTALPGADGVLAMLMGSRGYPIVVRGTFRSVSTSYQTARGQVQQSFDNAEGWCNRDPETYYYWGYNYQNVIWERVEPIPGPDGKLFQTDTSGHVFADFIAYGRGLA